MKTLRNMLFAIIASSLVFSTSANAGDVSLSGSMEVAFTKDTGETGNPMGLEDEMTASYSTELDNGMSVEYKMTLDRMAFDDNELKFGTDYGSFAFTSMGSPMDANDNITPTAFEEAEYAANTGYIDISALSGNGSNLIRYGNEFFGWAVDASYNPRYGSGDGNADDAPTGTTSGDWGEVYEIALKGNPLAIAGIDGVSMSLGYGETEGIAKNRADAEMGFVALTYAYGPLTVGAQKSAVSYGNQGTGKEAATNWAKNTNIGVALAVNDNLSVSYQETESQKHFTNGLGITTDSSANNESTILEADTISIAYTVGGLSIKYAESSVDNDTYSVGTSADKSTLSIGVAY